MGTTYEIVKKNHRLLASLYEMQSLEALLATVAADAKDQAPDEMSKKILNKWAMESAEYFRMVEEVISLLHEEAKTVGDQCHHCIEDMAGWSLVFKYAKKYMLGDVTRTKTSRPVEDLYTLAKRNLELGEDAAESYSKLSQLVANRRAKDMLIRLSALEKQHHAEAQLLVDTLEKMYSAILKQ
jgi:hypothetical protein